MYLSDTTEWFPKVVTYSVQTETAMVFRHVFYTERKCYLENKNAGFVCLKQETRWRMRPAHVIRNRDFSIIFA